MTVLDVINLLFTQNLDAIVVTQPTSSSPAPTTHATCNGTGIIAGQRDAVCKGTGLIQNDPLVRIIATSGTVTATPIPVLT